MELSKKHDSMLMIADYHALTTMRDPAQLQANIMSVARDYLAVGIDPNKDIIFKQSDVPEHMELSWIFQCLVSVSFLELAHAYKDKIAQGMEANAGLFAYPMLMAADILMYDTDVVPVGTDQRQHVEYAREAANKFNNAYGATFKEPKEMILRGADVVPGTDGRKMSKSYNNTIPLFGTKDEIKKSVMSILTDSKGESPENVYAIHALFKTKEELAVIYKANKGNYKALKEALIEDMSSYCAGMREMRESITDEEVKRVLREGGEKARALASGKMRDVRQKVGVSIQ
ncbi:MAG: tryptophan--tRNA ligase, partial [Candidatus Kaiserbacteria bacterium]|nr:tryptophan--tRNA ligase [Candidatus Kaiserbacteria bacterium]